MNENKTTVGPTPRARRVVLALLLLVGARWGVSQNIATAQLSGTVRDPSGALVAGATVIVADPTKGFSHTVQADAQGNYQALLLPPGVYTVTVRAPGFSDLIDRKVVLTTGEEAELPFAMTASGDIPCGNGPRGPYVTPPLLNFFRRSALNKSLANFLVAQGAGQCVALTGQIAAADGIGVGQSVPFGDMTPNLTTGTSDYNALSVNLRKRFSAGYEFLVSYTWSHAIDDSTDVVSTADAPQNNFNPNAERSTSTFDQRHRLVLSGVYNAGRQTGNGFMDRAVSGWTVAPIIEIASGRPFNVVTGTDTNFDFDPLTDRPNAVAVGRGQRAAERHPCCQSTRRQERSTCHATSMHRSEPGRTAPTSTAPWAATRASSRSSSLPIYGWRGALRSQTS